MCCDHIVSPHIVGLLQVRLNESAEAAHKAVGEVLDHWHVPLTFPLPSFTYKAYQGVTLTKQGVYLLQVYFNESAEVARKAVGEVLDRWQALLARVPEDEQAKLQRSMGLKIEQLKAEMKELDELHA